MYPSLLRFPSGGLFAEFDELQRQMERLFAPRGTLSIRAVERGFPAINIGSTGDAVEVYAFAPGLDPASIDVTVDKGLLTLAGERKSDVQVPSAGDRQANGNGHGKQPIVYARERSVGSFRRVVSLPDDADPERVQATYRDGILRIRIEKHEASKPRRIEIKDTPSQQPQGATA